MVRGCAAAEADIADIKMNAFLCELSAFVAIAGERIERRRKRPAAGNTLARGVAQSLECRLRFRGPVRNGKRCDMTGDCLPNAPNDRHERPGPALAVEADNISARSFEPFQCVDDRHAVEHLLVPVNGKRYDSG